MKEKNSGWCWHVHHEELFEWCTDWRGREHYIGIVKPLDEVPTRLRLMHWIKGELPKAVLADGQTCTVAWKAYFEAGAACKAAEAEGGMTFTTKLQAWTKARLAYEDAADAYGKTIESHHDEIEALHKLECPNCPWDGTTIFPEAKEEP